MWQLTREWLPERLGGWVWLLAAHLPVFAVVTVIQTFVMVLISAALADQRTGPWGSFLIQLRGRLNAQLLIYTAIAGTGAAITLYERYQDRLLAASRLEAELAAARLQALRGHLQPHFLFNSLHSIAALARTGDTAGVVRLTAGLSELLRYVLDAGDRHSAPLDEELRSSSATWRFNGPGFPIGSPCPWTSRPRPRTPACPCSWCSRSSRTR